MTIMMRFGALLAEFIGTFALIFVGVLVGHHLSSSPLGLVGVALGHGLAIACLASATGAISGGHLNPAVTFGLLIAKKIDAMSALGYIVAQCLGAIAAGYAAVFIAGENIAASQTPALSPNVGLAPGLVAEAIATFFLVFVVFGTAVDRRAPKVGALFIGLTVTMGILAIGPLTGGALNPARWVGAAVPGGNFDHPVVYIAGPLLGAAVAALVYSLCMAEKAEAAGGAA